MTVRLCLVAQGCVGTQEYVMNIYPQSAAIVKRLTRITFYDKARVRFPLAVRLPTRMVNVLKLSCNKTRKKMRQRLEGKSTTKPAYTLECKVIWGHMYQGLAKNTCNVSVMGSIPIVSTLFTSKLNRLWQIWQLGTDKYFGLLVKKYHIWLALKSRRSDTVIDRKHERWSTIGRATGIRPVGYRFESYLCSKLNCVKV